MNSTKFRAWMFQRQGLNKDLYTTAAEALEFSGWQRGVGGTNPYIAFFARTGEGREKIDSYAANLDLFELPSARGCTYVLPSKHFTLGLAAGRGFANTTEIATARKLGVEDSELEALKTAIYTALAQGELAPVELKDILGDKVRNLGEVGKKKGLTTTLPLALGILQSEGRIRRKPLNGRLDTQRYAYELWQPPLDELPSEAETTKNLTEHYFTVVGVATLKEFREFSGFTVKRAKEGIKAAEVVPFENDSELMGLPYAYEEYMQTIVPKEPAVRLVSSLDSFFLLRRGATYWQEEEDTMLMVPTDKGMVELRGLTELWSNGILDRGRLIGLWEYDYDEAEIAYWCWVPLNETIQAEIQAVQEFIRTDLEDSRAYSLDSPASRRSRITVLRALQTGA